MYMLYPSVKVLEFNMCMQHSYSEMEYVTYTSVRKIFFKFYNQ